MSVPCLKIMPIKKMVEWVNACGIAGVAVLVASSYELDRGKLPDNCVVQIFDDIDGVVVGRSFTREKANAYASFVKNLARNVDVIICACNAGESRSAALCAALCEYYGVSSDWIWDSLNYHPNMYVFELFAQALGVEVADARMEELFLRNRDLFTKTIMRARAGTDQSVEEMTPELQTAIEQRRWSHCDPWEKVIHFFDA